MAPDGNGNFSTFIGTGGPILNNSDVVVFSSTLGGTSGGSSDNQISARAEELFRKLPGRVSLPRRQFLFLPFSWQLHN